MFYTTKYHRCLTRLLPPLGVVGREGAGYGRLGGCHTHSISIIIKCLMIQINGAK